MGEQVLKTRCHVRRTLASLAAVLLLVLVAAPAFPEALPALECNDGVVTDVLTTDADPDTDSEAFAPAPASEILGTPCSVLFSIAANQALARQIHRPLPRGPPEIR